MKLSDFNFELPDELIARYPLSQRSDSRLLCVADDKPPVHRKFTEILQLVEPGDLLVFNDTKVIPARLFGQKITGGQIEVLVERILDNRRVIAQVRASKPPRIGDYLLFSQNIKLIVLNRQEQFYELGYEETERTILNVIESIGLLPLPPYMHRVPDETDKERYQTVYAKHDGSVAAPTAGLHFDEVLLAKLHEKKVEMGYLTLHIGAGTFAPVRTESIFDHKMHPEYLEVPPLLCEQIKATKSQGKRVIAVGTTSMRSLETACQGGEIAPFAGETSIFIYPGYQFRCVDTLITNLHLPHSTLLMLVCAFGGYENMMHAYRVAVENRYRFYSYGDAMWIHPKGNALRIA